VGGVFQQLVGCVFQQSVDGRFVPTVDGRSGERGEGVEVVWLVCACACRDIGVGDWFVHVYVKRERRRKEEDEEGGNVPGTASSAPSFSCPIIAANPEMLCLAFRMSLENPVVFWLA
jgi:hypothetical protein